MGASPMPCSGVGYLFSTKIANTPVKHGMDARITCCPPRHQCRPKNSSARESVIVTKLALLRAMLMAMKDPIITTPFHCVFSAVWCCPA
eukprot:6944327-Pyramimonas_sp.AAC.1